MTLHRVTIRAKGTTRAVVGDLVGDDGPGGGIGGWEGEQAGKQKKPVLRYAGRPGRTQQITLMFDGVDTGTVVESAVRQLETWGAGRKNTQPPRLSVTGRLLRSPASVSWVITGLEYGEQIRRGDGRRIRQEVTVSLAEWNKAPAKKKPKKGKKS